VIFLLQKGALDLSQIELEENTFQVSAARDKKNISNFDRILENVFKTREQEADELLFVRTFSCRRSHCSSSSRNNARETIQGTIPHPEQKGAHRGDPRKSAREKTLMESGQSNSQNG